MDAHYLALGVPLGASPDAVRRAYRSLALRWHPDKHKDGPERAEAAERFLAVQAAYEALSGGERSPTASLFSAAREAWREEMEQRRHEREQRQRQWDQKSKEQEERLAAQEAERRRKAAEWDAAFDARLARRREQRRASKDSKDESGRRSCCGMRRECFPPPRDCFTPTPCSARWESQESEEPCAYVVKDGAWHTVVDTKAKCRESMRQWEENRRCVRSQLRVMEDAVCGVRSATPTPMQSPEAPQTARRRAASQGLTARRPVV